MANMEVNLDELKGLKRWYGDQPDRVRRATGAMLNHFAFGTRTKAIRHIDATMTVRNTKFVSGRVKVTQALKRTPVARQRSTTGSVPILNDPKRGDFTGWIEQEHGVRQRRNRFQTMKARNDVPQKQVRHIVRLKPKNRVVKPRDYGMKSTHSTEQFIATALRKKENKMIMVEGRILKRRRNKFETVQVLSRPKEPKRDKWMLTSRNAYFRSTNLDALWRRSYGATMRPPPKR